MSKNHRYNLLGLNKKFEKTPPPGYRFIQRGETLDSTCFWWRSNNNGQHDHMISINDGGLHNQIGNMNYSIYPMYFKERTYETYGGWVKKIE